MIHNTSSSSSCDDPAAGYYFFHIPKTAGTSLTSVLETIFAQEEIAPPHLWHQILDFDKTSLAGYRLYRGHFYAALDKIVKKSLKTFVFLRDPIKRALSHYGHVVRDSGHYLNSRATELGSLKGYLLDPVTRETVRNFQAKSLVMDFDPLDMAKKLTKSELANLELEKLIETTPIDLPDDVLLERAKSALRNFCCIGITERFDDSLWLLSKVFEWNITSSCVVLNTNPGRLNYSQISCDEHELLEELNSVDVELYRYARSLFEEKLQCYRRISDDK